MTAMATARRVGGDTSWPISLRVSSTWTTSLRMLAVMFCVFLVLSLCGCGSAQAVPLADVFRQQAAHACVDAVAGAHREDEDDLVRGRCAGHAHLDGVE